MKTLLTKTIRILLAATILASGFTQNSFAQENTRAIEFPDIPGYRTLKCDFHMHTVFSDGNVWPNIRVQEALRDSLDAISITDHLEYQPKKDEVPHADRNASYKLALKAARNSGLIVVNGAEITRSMPPGHANAIFLKDANKLNVDEPMEAFREAKKQEAFVFWNHPHWTAQQADGIATLTDLHIQLINEGLISGIEIYNETTYSDEALDIAHEHNLTLLGNSDIHGLIDWKFSMSEGAHRPVTLVFASEKNEQALKEAMEERRTAVWFDNTLVGDAQYVAPLVENSLELIHHVQSQVQRIELINHSDASYILENTSAFTLHNKASVFILEAHQSILLQVKTPDKPESFDLKFKVLNAFTAPGEHPEISFLVE
ncbi:MAG: Sb-PDE family phosphodiesterase [Bacteroidota bacterium]